MFYLLRAPVVKNYAKLAIDIKKKTKHESK